VCGIAGKLWLDGERPADVDTVAAMVAGLSHRGPDDEGLLADGPMAFGHRRLTIVDLSRRGRQPMVDGALMLVANGEIYNHAELRAELSADGHNFASDCDVEVIAPLYRRWWPTEGPRFVRRLAGMFAFALWDGEARRLVLARDRTGQKPLVYSLDGERFAFASELAALRSEPTLDRTPDWQALSDYLAFRVVPHPATAWRGARKLSPGSVMVVEDGQVSERRYWRLPAGTRTSATPTFQEAAKQVEELLSASVRRRLMSDVPLGALLSGGIDSAAVVAFMAEHHDGKIATFTIGFEDSDYDETGRAAATARLFGTDHHVEIVRPDAVELLGDLVGRYGEPFADSSAIPTFLVSRMAREHVKVVLTGDGGDETFAGYDRYRALALSAALSRPVAAPARLALAAAGACLPAGGQRSLGTRLRRFCAELSQSPRRRNHAWRLGMSASVREGLLTPEGQARLGTPSFYGADVDGPLPLNEALVLDIERYLPDDILVKLDIASMAHGLEARSPFLDHELMEAVAALPANYKRRGRISKRLLKAALAGRLPPDVLAAPKRGFGVPLDAWFRGPLAGHVRDVLLSESARRRGLFRPQAVEALIESHVRGEVAVHETLFTLLILERWFLNEEAA
jgi:asparagine synthase (glutamine-hydrolysing)